MKKKKVFLAGLALALTLSIIMGLGGCAAGQKAGETRKNQVEDRSLKVMTYNIHHGAGLDKKLDLDRIAEVIRQADTDVVGLNEVDNNYGPRSRFMDESKYIAEQLGMHYVYGPAITSGDPKNPNQYGDALLSKYPIKQSKNHKLYHPKGYEPRVCIEATIEIKGAEYTFMVTHLDHRSTQVRVKQAQDIVKLVGDRPGKTIFMGDLNAPPPADGQDEKAAKNSRPIAIFMEIFKDTFVLAGAGGEESFHGGRRIDYIFVSPDLAEKVVKCEVVYNDLTAVASDHRPVVVQIKQ